MGYMKKTWRDGEVINPEALNNMEGGIAEANSTASASKVLADESSNRSKQNSEKIKNQDSEVKELKARMDIFASLPEGSTTSDAELIDMRLGADSVIYPTAGEAQRTQFNAKVDKSAIVQELGDSPTDVMSQGATTDEFGNVYSTLAKRTYNRFNKYNYRIINGVRPNTTSKVYYESQSWLTIYFDIPVVTGDLIQFYSPVICADYGVNSFLATLTNDVPEINGGYVQNVNTGEIATELRGYVVATGDTTKATFSFSFVSETDENERIALVKSIVDNICVVILSGAQNPRYYDYPYIPYYIPDVTKECFDAEILAENGMNVRHTSELVVRHGSSRISNGVVTLGAGWSGSISDGFVHTAGQTEPISITGMFWSGDWVLVTVKNSNVRWPREVFVSVGEQTLVDTYFGKETSTVLLKCESGVLKITPTSAFSGTITLESVYRLSAKGDYSTTLNLDTFHYGDATPQLGWWNVLLGGEHSFQNVIAATRCISIGAYSLDAIQYGSRHVAIGTYALRAMIEGERNVSIGADSLYQTKKADDNVAIGFDTNGGKKDATYRNVSLGNYSMCDAQEASEENVAVGHYAGRYASKWGTYVGVKAGYKASGSGNTVIGAYAMGGNIDRSGRNNTVVGRNAQCGDADVNGSTVIGYNANATKDNQVVIGGDTVVETLLKGDLIVRATDGTLKQIVFNSNGTLGWAAVE